MPKQIKRTEVAEQDIFRDIRDSGAETIKIVKELNEGLRGTAETLKKEIAGAKFGNTEEINKFVKAVKEAEKAQKQKMQLDEREKQATRNKIKAENELRKLQAEKIKTQKNLIKETRLLNTEKERQAKAEQKAAQAAKDENNQYKKLVKNTRDLKNESKRLAAELLQLEQAGKRNTTEYRKLNRTYKDVTKAAQQGDEQLKKIDATVGDNFRNVGNYSGAVDKLKGTLLRLGAAFGVFQAVKGAGQIVADFDQAQGDLQAISGKTADELKGLTAQAKELGATTQFSATQITEMQIELAKLGFTNDQISKSTGAVANFAAATGAEIPNAAALAGAALRAFELDASEMERVVSTLGVATTKSALDFSKLETGLSTVAPVANAFGFSIEETTALLGGLSNAGFDASSAATATRNLLLKMADSGGELAKALGRPIKNLDDLTAGLDELQAGGIDLAGALELTDSRSVAAFQTFLKGTKTLKTLKTDITGANEQLEEMAAKRLDTISGQFTLLGSAWEGFILSLNEGTGAGEAIKNMIGFIAENLTTLMSILGRAVRLWVLYRIATSKAAQNMADLTSAFIKSAKSLKLQNISLKNMTKGLKQGAGALSKFGKALKGIGFAVALDLAIEFAMALYDVASGAKRARLETEAMNEGLRVGAERSSAQLEKINGDLDKQLTLLEEKQKLELAAAKTADQRAKIEDKYNAEKEKAYANASKNLEDQIKKEEALYAAFEKRAKEAVKQSRKQMVSSELTSFAATVAEFTGQAGLAGVKQAADLEIAIRNKLIEKTAEHRQTLASLRAGMEALSSEQRAALVDIQAETIERQKAAGKAKKLNTEIKTQIDLYKELIALIDQELSAREKLKNLDIEADVQAQNDLLSIQTEIQKEAAQTSGTFDFTQIQEIINTRSELEKQAIKEAADFEIDTLKQQHARRFEEMRGALEDERAELLAQEGLTDAQRLLIEANYQTELEKIKTLEKASEETMALDIKVIREQAKADLIEIEREARDEQNAIYDDLISDTEKYEAEKAKAEEEAAKAEEDRLKAAAARRREIAEALTAFLIQQSDKRIEALEKEIQAAEKQADYFRELAAAGNIEAKQSLSEQNRIIAEANRQKIEEERRQQRIQLAGTAYSTYQNKIEQGSEQPLADTIRDITLLQQFINSLPAFEKGTEDTGTNGKGVDGRGGFHAILHPNERVLTKEQNALIGGLTNNDLARLANEYNTGQLINAGEGALQLGGPWSGEAVLDRLQSIEETIKNKPETAYNFEKVAQNLGMFTKQTKTGNTIVYNRFRIEN